MLFFTIKLSERLDYQIVSKRDRIILERFVERRENLKKVCKAEGLVGLDQYLVESVAREWPNMLYVDKHKLLYCSIPKEGVPCSMIS